MGYNRRIIYQDNQGRGEDEITITTDIAQLLLSGDLLMIDRNAKESGERGEAIFAVLQDLKSGVHRHHKRYKFPSEVRSDLWVKYKYHSQFQRDFDFS